jgi:type II secretion system protein I
MKSENGFSLIEVLIAMAIIGIVAVGLLSALTTSSRAAIQTDEMDTARVLAQSQMEYVKKQPFLSSYELDEAIMSEYPGYSVSIAAAPADERDVLIQKITVTVLRNGQAAAVLEGCKAKR